MIIYKAYLNDNNYNLKKIQHDLYGELVGYLFGYAKTRFLKAASLLLQSSDLVEKLKEVESFDHRVLQETHDIIAARYRYLHDDGGQLQLFLTLPKKEIYRNGWCQWFHEEARSLVDYDEFCRAVAKAVVFQNTEISYLAENQIREFLTVHYRMDDWFLNLTGE